MVCLLNRKPYRDREGNVRTRSQTMCCGKKDCLLSDQPDGQIVKRGGPKRKKKFKTVVVTEKKKGK